MLKALRPAAVWIALVALTLLSYASLSASTFTGPRIAGSVVIAIALAKAWLIGMRYMELDDAAIPLRLAYLAWIAIVGAVLIPMFW